MKGKKGFLLGEETIKILLALVGLGLLIFLLAKVYYGSQDKELEQAEASLERIVDAINSKAESVEIYNPDGWRIISWPYGNKIPNSCKSKKWDSCLCICPGIGLSGTALALSPFSETVDEFAEVCEKKSSCQRSDFFIKSSGLQSPIEIEPPLMLSINYQNKEITLK
jgi:hypothetical protein